MKNKKILLVGRASLSLGGKATGGISKHIEDLSIKLTENNFEVIIWDFTLKKSYNKSNVRIEGLNYTDIILGLIYSIFSLNIIFNKSYSHLPSKDKFSISIQSWKLQEYILSNDIQVVHVHSLNRPVTHFLRLKFPNIKIIITDHGFWQKKGISKNANNPTLGKIFHNINFSTKIITISSFANEQFENFNLPTDKNITIPNPIFISKIPYKTRPKKDLIFFNGFNKSLEIKNLKILLEALNFNSELHNYKLVAIVDKRAESFIKSKSFNFDIDVLSAQEWDEIVDLYNSCKILVVPSKSESFGLVYLEALAVGTPIVGFSENVKEFQKMLKLDIGEPFNSKKENYKDLSFKIEKTLAKQYDPLKLRKAVELNYSWDKSILNFISLYNS